MSIACLYRYRVLSQVAIFAPLNAVQLRPLRGVVRIDDQRMTIAVAGSLVEPAHGRLHVCGRENGSVLDGGHALIPFPTPTTRRGRGGWLLKWRYLVTCRFDGRTGKAFG